MSKSFLTIIKDKANGTDCTEEESAEIKAKLRVALKTDNIFTVSLIEKYFPIESAEVSEELINALPHQKPICEYLVTINRISTCRRIIPINAESIEQAKQLTLSNVDNLLFNTEIDSYYEIKHVEYIVPETIKKELEDQLIDDVISEIQISVFNEDLTAIKPLLCRSAINDLIAFLPESKHNFYKPIETT